MPTYRYRREDGSTFEVDQRITDEALSHDDDGHPVTRVLFAPIVRFRGPGFHNSDYAPTGGRARATVSD